MLYLDANIFIGAIISGSPTGEACKAVLDALLDGKLQAATSALTFDEVLWKLRSVMGYEAAIETTQRMLELPLKIIPADALIIREALDLALRTSLKPRDAIHAASMKVKGITDICSTDPDFDALHGVKRISPENQDIDLGGNVCKYFLEGRRRKKAGVISRAIQLHISAFFEDPAEFAKGLSLFVFTEELVHAERDGNIKSAAFRGEETFRNNSSAIDVLQIENQRIF